MELQGNVAVLTGASSGIGRETAVVLARAGMHVVAVARREDRLQALAEEVPGIVPYPADVTRLESVQDLKQYVVDEYGACHLLVNNAGASIARQFTGEEERADLEREIQLNYVAPLRFMATFADLLQASQPAQVINVGSVAGRAPVIGPGYSAAKAAVMALSEAASLTWPDKGVVVSQVNPGLIATEGFAQSEFMRTPLKHFIGYPEDVAKAIRDVAEKGTRERTVPRWYRPVYLIRHIAPPVYFAVARQVNNYRQRG